MTTSPRQLAAAKIGFYPVPSLMRDAALAAIAKARGKP